MQKVISEISTEFIKLESLQNFEGVAETGGDAKLMIQEGAVEVNGEVCTMRGKKLHPGDKFAFNGDVYLITQA